MTDDATPSDSALLDRRLRAELPSTIAVPWHRVCVATGDLERLERVHLAVEATLRTMAALLVPDALRGDAAVTSRARLVGTGRMALGAWLGLVRDLASELAARGGPPPFVLETLGWLFRQDGRKTEAHDLLERLVELRNDATHRQPAGASPARAEEMTRRAVADARQLLASLRWLGRYRLAHVARQRPLRRGGSGGEVRFLVGLTGDLEPVRAEWTACLAGDGVYLLAPDAQAVLEVSPLIQVRDDRVWLWRGSRDRRKLVLADERGAEERVPIAEDGRTVTWQAWVARGGEPLGWQANEDRLGTLAWRPSASEGAPGELVANRFEVEDLLGEGGLARVYRARDRVLGGVRALKVMRTEVCSDPQYVERFRRSVEAVRGLRSRHLVCDVEVGLLADGRRWLAMPYYPGGTLRERIEAGPGALADVLRWGGQLLTALRVLHEASLVHRDVKPANVLLDGDGQVALADFDLLRRDGDTRLTRTMQQLGTLAYLAPEVRLGQEATARSDVYAAGLVLHELALGGRQTERPGEGLPAPLDEVVAWMTARDPDARPTARAALERLRDLLRERRAGGPARAPAATGAAGASPAATGAAGAPPAGGAPRTRPVTRRLRVDPAAVVRIPPGRFLMGSAPTAREQGPDEAPHVVELTRAYEIGVVEVTRARWHAVMGGPPPRPDERDLPQAFVTWQDAVGFCNALSLAEGLPPAYRVGEQQWLWPDPAAPGWRLPTEAEWERACRAGSADARYAMVGDAAWHKGNAGGAARPIGQKAPNQLGIFDMLGLVAEWCWDWYGPYPSPFAQDPIGPPAGTDRVARGGSFEHMPGDCRAARRLPARPHAKHAYLGFRVARTVG